jgi:hypothetical protein
MTTTERLARWVASHGFTAVANNESECVQVVIPTTRDGVPSYPQVETVRTLSEARRALGY